MFSPGYRSLTLLGFLAAIMICGAVASAVSQTETSVSESAKSEGIVRFGVVIDNSGAFRLSLERGVRIVSAFLRTDRSASEGFLITFADTTKIRLQQEFTSDRQELIDSVENVYAESGNGAFLDAVKLAADHLVESGDPADPGYLLIVTNGEDRGSSTKIDDLIKLLKTANIKTFIVGLTDRKMDPKLIDRLAKETGGKRYLPLSIEDISAVADAIRADVGK